jgi:hypothetical protein
MQILPILTGASPVAGSKLTMVILNDDELITKLIMTKSIRIGGQFRHADITVIPFLVFFGKTGLIIEFSIKLIFSKEAFVSPEYITSLSTFPASPVVVSASFDIFSAN